MLCRFTFFFITAFLVFGGTASLLHVYTNFDTLPEGAILGNVFGNVIIVLAVILINFFDGEADKCQCTEKSKDEIRQDTVCCGLTMIAIFSFSARFVVFYIQSDYLDVIASCNFCLATTFMSIYYVFVHRPARRYTWNNNQSNVFGFIFCAILVAHGYFLYQNIKSAMGYEMYQAMVFYHVALGLICASSTLEIFAIMAGKMDLKEDEKLESVKVVSKKTKTSSSLKDEKKKDAEKK